MTNVKLLNEGGKYAVSMENCKVVLSEEKQKNLAATIDVSELTGSDIHFHANANGKDVVVIVPTMNADSEAFCNLPGAQRIVPRQTGVVCR